MNLRSDLYIHATIAYCPVCKKSEFTRIFANNDGVFMQRMCPLGNSQPEKIAGSYEWYLNRIQASQTIDKSDCNKKSEHGCPFDCGLCEWHTASIKLPVFSITNDCNLDCPICFTYNRTDVKYYKTLEDTEKIISNVFRHKTKKQIVNLTGGEPTLHPELKGILDLCIKEKIERITMNSNGLRIANDRELAQMLKTAGIQVVLSLDTFDKDKSILIHGKDITEQKRKALQVLEEFDIPTTILSVCIKDVNENDVAEIASSYMKKSFVKSITIQNMTFTGKNGKNFQPRKHITIDEIENLLASQSVFDSLDFFPLASYHPLCYSVAYYIVIQEKIISLTKIVDKQKLTDASEDFYYLEPNKNLIRDFMDGINRLWAEDYDNCFISDLKNIVKELYTNENDNEKRKSILEKHIKSIYIHPHMDEDNFDIDRVSRCGDIVPDESGRMIPACSYNLLYRQNDSRFWIE